MSSRRNASKLVSDKLYSPKSVSTVTIGVTEPPPPPLEDAVIPLKAVVTSESDVKELANSVGEEPETKFQVLEPALYSTAAADTL